MSFLRLPVMWSHVINNAEAHGQADFSEEGRPIPGRRLSLLGATAFDFTLP